MSLRESSDLITRDITTASGRTVAVLVVEEEPFIAMDIDDILQTAGMVVEIRSSRAAALKWLESSSPVVAILDLYLRDGDGLAIAVILQ